MIKQLARKREDIEHASGRGFHRQIFDRVGETECTSWVARVELGGYDRARPAAYSSHERDVLAAVGPAIANRLADDPAPGLEAPELLAAACVDRFEPAVHGPIENYAAGGHQRGTPDWQIFWNLPHLAVVESVPCSECAAIAAGTCIHLHVGADIRRTSDVVRL